MKYIDNYQSYWKAENLLHKKNISEVKLFF